MENNNFTTPAPEDIPIRDPEVVAAPEKQKKPLPPGKRRSPPLRNPR